MTTGLAVLQDQGTPAARPRTRGDCIDGERPCPWVSCRHHLGLEVSKAGTVEVLVEPDALEETCALDVADRGPHTLEEVGQCLLVTRERIRQIEERAMPRLRKRLERAGITEEVVAELGRPLGGPLAQAQEKESHGVIGIGWPAPLPEDVRRATGGRYHEFAISDRSCSRRPPAEKGEIMARPSVLATLDGKAAEAVKSALAGKLSPAELTVRLADLGSPVPYKTVWLYLYHRGAAGKNKGKTKAGNKAKAPRQPRKVRAGRVCVECGHAPAECICDQEPEAAPATVALVARPREPGFVVLPDGKILAPTAAAAVEVARLLGTSA